MKNLLENCNLLFAMTVLTAISIFLKCICSVIYQVLLRDSEQIVTTKNKWIRSMCTKFEACYKLRIPVHNPTCFVQNHMAHYRFLGFSMKSLENTDIFCALIVTGSTLLCIISGLYYEFPARWIFVHSVTLVFFLLFLALAEIIFQVRHKRKILELQLTHYFENTLRGKLENQYFHTEETKAYRQAYFTNTPEMEDTCSEIQSENHSEEQKNGQTISYEDNYEPVISADMQELIDSLLEESKLDRKLNEKKDKLMTAASNEKFRLVEEIMKEYL